MKYTLTSHEIARLLLELPDLPTYSYDGEPIQSVNHDKSENEIYLENGKF